MINLTLKYNWVFISDVYRVFKDIKSIHNTKGVKTVQYKKYRQMQLYEVCMCAHVSVCAQKYWKKMYQS